MYIEAEKEAHVRDAIRGIRTIFVSKGVRLVPLAEMVHSVTVNRTAKATICECLKRKTKQGMGFDGGCDLDHPSHWVPNKCKQ